VTSTPEAQQVQEAARGARAAAPALATASPQTLDDVLRAMAANLTSAAGPVLQANQADMRAATDGGLPRAMRDRLLLDDARLTSIAQQLSTLAAIEHEPRERHVRDLDDGLVVIERRRPVGVIGANFEARPNVTVDIASQLIKSRNAGVLRTGSAALRSAAVLTDHVIAPALEQHGLDPASIGLIRIPGQAAARALVREPALIPLVILRGSGDSTRALAKEAAEHGVRTLAHADGGGVLYVHPSASRDDALGLIAASLDRLGVCNRLNLLLVDERIWEDWLPDITKLLAEKGIAPSLPPYNHPLGLEWALEDGHEATVTVGRATSPRHAAAIANDETSGLAAGIAATDPDAATEFLDAYAGTGAFWNAPTRLLDGFKLLSVPETGINIDKLPGPRGPVTFRDLYLRQFVVRPSRAPRP
jgi:glutamate-5-semialdehyde dehydrogenase